MRGEINVSESVHVRKDVVDGVHSDRDCVYGREIVQHSQIEGFSDGFFGQNWVGRKRRGEKTLKIILLKFSGCRCIITTRSRGHLLGIVVHQSPKVQ